MFRTDTSHLLHLRLLRQTRLRISCNGQRFSPPCPVSIAAPCCIIAGLYLPPATRCPPDGRCLALINNKPGFPQPNLTLSAQPCRAPPPHSAHDHPETPPSPGETKSLPRVTETGLGFIHLLEIPSDEQPSGSFDGIHLTIDWFIDQNHFRVEQHSRAYKSCQNADIRLNIFLL